MLVVKQETEAMNTAAINRHLPAATPGIALPDALPLVVLSLAVWTFRNHLPAWGFMWLLAGAIYAGCKWLTYSDAARHLPHPATRSLGYLLAWPGMDARAFFATDRVALTPTAKEWVGAWGKTLLGLGLLWLAAPWLADTSAVTAVWIGMVGLILTLHFGVFHLLSLAWRRAGVPAEPIMRAPLFASSLSDFWSRRWNAAYHELAHRYAFRPLHRRIGTAGATLAVFLLSGLVHDLVISVPARGGYGWPTAYFGLHGAALLLERSPAGRAAGLGEGWRGRSFALAVCALPLGWLFHPPFVANVIRPFLTAIHAL